MIVQRLHTTSCRGATQTTSCLGYPLVDLFGGCPDVGSLLADIAVKRDGFEPASEAGTPFAKLVMLHYMKLFLDRKVSPYDFCCIVHSFEAAYMDTVFSTANSSIIYIPDWIGDLWNVCDWCDETWTHTSASHMVEEVQRILLVLSDDE